MTRLMYDSTNIQDDPAGAHLVAYYVDGIYAVSAATVRARFPSAVLVPISAIGTDNGIVGDVEPGCITLGYCVEWVKLRRLANADPTVYVNETYGWGPARAAFHAAGVPEPHWWVANYDGIPVVPAGAVAKQYANPTLTHGHFDLSVVADYWPGVDGHVPGVLTMEADVHAAFVALQDELTVAVKSPILQAQTANTAAIVAAIKAIPPPAVSISLGAADIAAIGAAIAAQLPTQSKPPAPPQAVKDWWASLMKYLGWA